MDTTEQTAIETASHVKRQRRSIEEKRRIVEETLEAGASVARVARRHAINANPPDRLGESYGVSPRLNGTRRRRGGWFSLRAMKRVSTAARTLRPNTCCWDFYDRTDLLRQEFVKKSKGTSHHARGKRAAATTAIKKPAGRPSGKPA